MQFLSSRLFGAVVATAIALAGLTPVARAQAASTPAAPPIVVGVLDVQYIIGQSKAAQGIRVALEKQASTYQAELAQQENSLRAADQQLMQQRASLSADEFDKKRMQLGQRVETLRQTAESRRKQLQTMENGAMRQVEQALLQAAAEIAQARGMTLVLNKSTVVLSAKSFDITQEALQKLNARLTSVKLPAPK
jgi:Skp family chaperone for outer membrane proteins